MKNITETRSHDGIPRVCVRSLNKIQNRVKIPFAILKIYPHITPMHRVCTHILPTRKTLFTHSKRTFYPLRTPVLPYPSP